MMILMRMIDDADGDDDVEIEEEMIEKATNANYQLSKRQITWLKKFEIKETFFANQSNMVIKILNLD